MNILIFGASGATGRELVQQGLAKGHVITAFVRNPLKLNIEHVNLIIRQGSIINHHQVEQVVKAQDAVISALGASSPFRYDKDIVDGVENIISAMQRNNVQRLIYMSFAGVRSSRSRFGFVIRKIAPLLLSTEIAGHEARERLIRNSELQWTIVRAPTLTNGKRIAKFRSGENMESKSFTTFISRADVADFMLQQLTDVSYIKQAPTVLY